MENENIRENEKLNEDVFEEEIVEEVPEETVSEEVPADETEEAADEDIIGDEWQTETIETVEPEETLTEEELAAKKKKKNIIVAICAVVIVVVAFAAYWVCRVEGVGENTIVSNVLVENAGVDAKNDNIKYENPVMAAVNTFTDKKDAVMTINGKSVNPDVFGYTFNMMGANCVYSLLQIGMLTNVADMDWNEKAFDTKMTYTEYAKGLATQNLIPIYVLIAEGEKHGISLSKEEEKEITDQLAELKEQYGDNFESALAHNGLSNENEYLEMQKTQKWAQKVYSDAENDLSKYISDEKLQASGGADKVTVKHILVAFDEEGLGDVTDEKRAAAKAEAEEVLKKLNEGGDFDQLMAEYNDDPGATPEGYTFADDGTMVQQFTDASFALEIGETSGLVETSYGYHIIKRMERTFTIEDYIAYLVDNAVVKIRKGNYQKAEITADYDVMFGTAEE